MANFTTAFEWTMEFEDPKREYALISDAPPGAHAISGINSAAFASDFAAIAAIPQAQRAPSIQRFYQIHFWNTWFDQLESDEIAKRVFDAAVNMGPGTAVKLLQEALAAALGAFVAVDGQWGPQTLQHANNCNPDMVCAEFRKARATHYRAIVEENPAAGKYLQGWLARANS